MCTVCKEIKNISEFNKNKNGKDGLSSRCRLCRKQSHLDNKERDNARNREYYKENKERITILHKKYANINKEQLTKYRSQYEQDNKQRIAVRKKKWYLDTLEERIFYHGSNAKFETYKNKLTIEESPKLSEDGISLEVKCRYCGKYFCATNKQIRNRLAALNSKDIGENSLYCSDGCKEACPIFGQRIYFKGTVLVSSREVNPLIRQMCFERDNWECQICGATQKEAQLHCHHIEGVAQNPRLGNDVKNTVALCKACHKEVHKLPGCNYYELQCKKD